MTGPGSAAPVLRAGLPGYGSIETQRLWLGTMSPEFLRASIAGNRSLAEEVLGWSLPEDWPSIPDVLALRLDQVLRNPDWEPWLTRVIGLRDQRRIVGVTGFHGPPGGDWLAEFAPGGLEFGYTIHPEWRRQGIALAASRALMAWARRTASVSTFVLSIDRENRASVALAKKLGFEKVGSCRHPERGEEDIYRRGPEVPVG